MVCYRGVNPMSAALITGRQRRQGRRSIYRDRIISDNDNSPSCSTRCCSRRKINPTTKTATRVMERVPPSLLYRNMALRDANEINIRRIMWFKCQLFHISSLRKYRYATQENTTTYASRMYKINQQYAVSNTNII